jgi:hypothetical protein
MKDNFFNVNSFLEKFKHLRNPLEDKVKILSIVNKELNSFLTEKEIIFSKGIIRFNTSSLIKNVIFFKKNLLIEEIQNQFPELGVKEIV